MTDEKQTPLAKAQAKYRKLSLQQARAGLATNLQSREGRAFLWWLLEITHVYEQPFRDNALRTAFNSGELNIGLQLQAQLMETSPEGFMNMMKEVYNERNQLERSYTTGGGDNAPDNGDSTDNQNGGDTPGPDRYSPE